MHFFQTKYDLNLKDNKFNEKSDGYEPIKYLDYINKTKTTYIAKRVLRRNVVVIKYISYSIKI